MWTSCKFNEKRKGQRMKIKLKKNLKELKLLCVTFYYALEISWETDFFHFRQRRHSPTQLVNETLPLREETKNLNIVIVVIC